MIMNRSEIIFLYDIADNNPNGDPLDSNKPRIDEETGENIVTDARLKRTIRDYLHDYKGEEIFVREIRDKEGKVQDAKKRASDFGKTKEEVSKNVLENCIDVRLFGGKISVRDKIQVPNKEIAEKVKKINRLENGGVVEAQRIEAGI